MVSSIFLDNTVLINFHLIGWFKHLEQLLGVTAKWVPSVRHECKNQSQKNFTGMWVPASTYLGSPVHPEPQARLEAVRFRNRLAGPSDSSSQHYGESETLAVIKHQMHANGISAVFVTDDKDARGLAKAEDVKTWTSWDLIKFIHRQKFVTDKEAIQAFYTMKKKHRGVPQGCLKEADFMEWLRSA